MCTASFSEGVDTVYPRSGKLARGESSYTDVENINDVQCKKDAFFQSKGHGMILYAIPTD